MDKELIEKLQTNLNSITYQIEGDTIEFWYARDLQKILDYDRWENFENVINKAKTACKASGLDCIDHFRDVTKMVKLGFGAERPILDIMLTRYACYLIAQNGDSKKEAIAFAQTYFAIQTRKLEILEQHKELKKRLDARNKLRISETELSENIYQRGVDDKGFGRIRSKGDNALFGGHNTNEMKNKLNIPKGRAFADFLPTVTITAKNLATEITNHNIKQSNLIGEHSITQEHVQNNKSVRNILVERGINPENLPASEDIQKIQRKAKAHEKKLIKESALPKIKGDKHD